VVSFAWLWALGCGPSVIPQYEAARDAALADPGAPEANWKPDAVLGVSPDQVEASVDPFLAKYGKFKGKIQESILGMTATATPDIQLSDITLSPSKICDSCLQVDARLDGEVAWDALGQKGKVPVKGRVKLDGELKAVKVGDAFDCTLTPRDVSRLDLDMAGLDPNIQAVLHDRVFDWAKTQLRDQIPPIPLGSFGGDGVPLRAITMIPTEGGGMQIRMLTRAKDPGKVDPKLSATDKGFRLVIAPESVIGLARAASFAAGPQAHDVVPEPTKLSIDGDKFDLGLRVWKVSGPGWWRDYLVHGTVTTGKRSIELHPSTVDEGDKSKGAALADPLAYLGEGIIRDAIATAVDTSLPKIQAKGAGDGLLGKVKIDEVRGESGALVVDGEMTMTNGKTPSVDRSDPPNDGGGARPRSPKPKPKRHAP
jgi:hypothetical protein